MSSQHFETFYQADWGDNARRARDARRDAIRNTQGLSGVVRGRVHHPFFGEGWDLMHHQQSGNGVDDVRVTPQGWYPQLPPTRVQTEEKWEASPIH